MDDININLQIYEFEQQLQNIIINSKLPVGIMKYILESAFNQITQLYNNFILQMSADQADETMSSKQQEERSFQVPVEITVPLQQQRNGQE